MKSNKFSKPRPRRRPAPALQPGARRSLEQAIALGAGGSKGQKPRRQHPLVREFLGGTRADGLPADIFGTGRDDLI